MVGVSKDASFAIVSSANPSRVKRISSPIALLKAIKNPTEMEGFRQCHIRDGAALVSWMCKLPIKNIIVFCLITSVNILLG